MNGQGCSFLLEAGKMHLTFPGFSISQKIPEDGDLRIQLDHLTDEDLGLPDFICDGVEGSDDSYLEDFNDRMKYLNHVFRGRVMTRAQRKRNMDELKAALSTQNSDAAVSDDISSENSSEPESNTA